MTSSSSMPEQQRRRRSPPDRDGDDEGLRRATAAAWRPGLGDGEDVTGTQAPLGDFVLIGTPGGHLLLAPTPLSSMKQQDEEVSAPPLRSENLPAAAAEGEKKRCVQCGATETPQWRIQPMGLGALCTACRIRLRPAEALREPVHVHVHLPPPATAPEKTQTRKRKPRHPRKSASTPHPQWRMGLTAAAGPSSLRNACGVRYRQGQGCRLLQEQEHRPAASPNLKPSEHACKHRGEEQQQNPPQPAAAMQTRAGDGVEQHLPPPPAQAHVADDRPMGEPISMDQLLFDAIDGSSETHIVYGVGGDLQMGDPSSLDQFLFDGPAAPLLIDDDEEDLVVD